MMCKKHILIVLASLRGGGAEKLMVEIANNASILGYKVTMFVGALEGPYINLVSENVEVQQGAGKKFSRSIPRLSKVLRKYDFDYVICSQEYVISVTYFAMLIAQKLKRIPIIGREASTPSKNLGSGFKSALMKYLIRFCYKRIDVLVAPTIEVKEDLINFYKLNRVIKVVSNPVDVSKIKSESTLPFDSQVKLDDRFKILVVGRLIESKGVQHVISALAKLKRDDYTLIVAGEGDYKVYLSDLAISLGISEKVKFLGFVENPFPLMKNASLLVLSSEYEGMPNSLIQASALGTPCLSTNCSGVVSELIQPNCIFRFGDVDELAELLLKVLEGTLVPANKTVQLIDHSEFLNNVLELYI